MMIVKLYRICWLEIATGKVGYGPTTYSKVVAENKANARNMYNQDGRNYWIEPLMKSKMLQERKAFNNLDY